MSFDEDDSSESYDDHDLLFGDHDDHDAHTELGEHSRRGSRRDRSRQRRQRRRRSFFVTVAAMLAVVVAAAGYVAFRHTGSSGSAEKDYAGSGSGSIVIQVRSGDGIDAIGSTLRAKNVIGSTSAFSTAAAANAKSAQIEPGFYRLRQHMSASAALTLLLDPASSVSEKVTIPEGLIDKDVFTRLSSALGVPLAEVQKAANDVTDLAPGGYEPASGALASLEGFFYPATYKFDPGTSASDAIQTIMLQFTSEDRSIGFAIGTKTVGITPYQALIIASIAQAEVKFATDAPMVARVILNRIAANRPLQVDATSAYAAKTLGLDPTTVNYATLDSPYNTYTHDGLPPTPIGNPGESSLQAAIGPPAGTWLYYVNIDAEGHLGFFTDQDQFTAAQLKCYQNNWGCAAP